MDKIRRSIRKSFRKAPSLTADTATSSAGAVDDGTALKTPWALDEKAVRQGICKFNVKYLGCCEVYESRGVHVCEGALQHLKVDFYIKNVFTFWIFRIEKGIPRLFYIFPEMD